MAIWTHKPKHFCVDHLNATSLLSSLFQRFSILFQIKRKEIDRLKQLQIALPRPSPRPCRKVCYSFLNNEDEYYTAESGKYSGQSDSDESLGVCNILQMLGKCNNCSTRTNRPDTAPSYSQLCQLPSTSAPTSTQSHDNCRCVNVQTLTCQCAKSIPTPKNNERQKFLQCTKKQRPQVRFWNNIELNNIQCSIVAVW